MSHDRARAVILTTIGIFIAGILMGSSPRDLPRPLGRNNSHAFTDYRPKWRSRLDTITSQEVDPCLILHGVMGPVMAANRSRFSPDRRQSADRPTPTVFSSRPTLPQRPRLALHLRC